MKIGIGLPSQRGRMLDAQLGELRRIWRGEAGIGPEPARPGGPQVLVGGDSRHAGPRSALHGDGWTMMVGTPEQFAAGVAVVRDAWTAARRPGSPRTMAVLYAALGPDARALVEGAVGGYYAWLGPEIAGWIAGTAATDEDGLREGIAGFATAGADEVVVIPCSAEPDQLERIGAVAVRRPAIV